MKKIFFWMGISMALGVSLMLSSCGKDEPPALELQQAPTGQVESGQIFQVTLRGVKGTSPLSTLEIRQDGQTVEDSRLSGDVTSGQYVLSGSEKEGFTFQIGIRAPFQTGAYLFEFVLTDENNQSDKAELQVTVGQTPLSITINSTNPIRGTQTGLYEVSISVRGGGQLAALTVYDGDGNLVPKENLYVLEGNTPTMFLSNPLPLTGDDQYGFDKIIGIEVTEYGISEYTFEVVSTNASTARASITIIVGTPLRDTSGVLMWNYKGPKKGSVDLHRFMTVSSSDTTRDIMDAGWGNNPAGQWGKQIKPVNGAELVMADAGIDYDAIKAVEQIESLFAQGQTVQMTPPLNPGDVFFVRSRGDYFVVRVAEVNETPNDNLDHYVLDIKGK